MTPFIFLLSGLLRVGVLVGGETEPLRKNRDRRRGLDRRERVGRERGARREWD
jgi:hypothetical protein